MAWESGFYKDIFLNSNQWNNDAAFQIFLFFWVIIKVARAHNIEHENHKQTHMR